MIDNPKYDIHAPKCVKDIVANNDTWAKIEAAVQTNTASNMIIVGPPGCGKSLFLKFALTGRQVLHIECTANSGLRDVRDSIRMFACGSRSPEGNLRWIVFKHADYLTSDTQAFLRRMLETTSNSTRFVFECREVGAMSEPILSRATLFNLCTPDETEIKYEIQRRTGFGLPAETVNAICSLSFGNVRAAILNALAAQTCAASNTLGQIRALLKARPGAKSDSGDWVRWAINTETTCRSEGIDLRDVLRVGWPLHPVVMNTCAIWSRLGGTSPRALFFDSIRALACEHKSPPPV